MSLRQQAKSGVIWTFAEQFSVQIINFVVQIMLARLLMPEDFGLVAMLTVFIGIGQTLMDGGMTTSIIRTKNPNQLDYSTVFFSNIFVSALIYIILYVGSPWIGLFFEHPILEDIIKLYALTFVIRSFVAVHVAKLTKEMNFKTQMKLQIPSTIIGAVVGVVLAIMDYGVWSLVWLNIAQALSFSIILWIFSKWKPKMIFDRKVFKHHFDYGYKLTISGLLTTIYLNLYKIVIGKNFAISQVGFFTNADNLRQFPISQLSNILSKVTFPLFANIQDDTIRLKSSYKTILSLVLTTSSLMMLILIIIAQPLYIILFGEKWLPAVPYFQILCIASIFLPINMYNLNILKVKGRSDLYLKVDVIKKIIGVTALIICIPFGIEAIIWSLCITNILFAYLNGYYSGSLMNYSLYEQIIDTLKIVLISLIPFGIVLYIKMLTHNNFSNLLEIIIYPILYLIIYIPIVYLLNRKIISDILLLIKK